jgi:hypothetical protein
MLQNKEALPEETNDFKSLVNKICFFTGVTVGDRATKGQEMFILKFERLGILMDSYGTHKMHAVHIKDEQNGLYFENRERKIQYQSVSKKSKFLSFDEIIGAIHLQPKDLKIETLKQT